MYNPLDFWPIVQRAFAMIRPARIVLVEAEVWPNLAAGARARGIPLALVNARLSERSERRFRQFRAVVAPTFRCLDLVCAQERRDIERWEGLGIPQRADQGGRQHQVRSRLTCSAMRPIARGGPASVTASTQRDSRSCSAAARMPGEEQILAETFLHLREQFPTLRSADRAAACRTHGAKCAKRVRAPWPDASRCAAKPTTAASPTPDCLLLDTTGELRNWYSVATVVFIGKSLTARGGQNPVEPILAGKPVVFGPHMENFASLARALVAEEAAIQVGEAGGAHRSDRRAPQRQRAPRAPGPKR